MATDQCQNDNDHFLRNAHKKCMFSKKVYRDLTIIITDFYNIQTFADKHPFYKHPSKSNIKNSYSSHKHQQKVQVTCCMFYIGLPALVMDLQRFSAHRIHTALTLTTLLCEFTSHIAMLFTMQMKAACKQLSLQSLTGRPTFFFLCV